MRFEVVYPDDRRSLEPHPMKAEHIWSVAEQVRAWIVPRRGLLLLISNGRSGGARRRADQPHGLIGDRDDLKRSTLVHELGHALFDGPSMLRQASQPAFAARLHHWRQHAG
jgi:hypothetical protein